MYVFSNVAKQPAACNFCFKDRGSSFFRSFGNHLLLVTDEISQTQLEPVVFIYVV